MLMKQGFEYVQLQAEACAIQRNIGERGLKAMGFIWIALETSSGDFQRYEFLVFGYKQRCLKIT